MKNKYIVTGATGKVGSMLIQRIDEKDFIGISRQEVGKNMIKADLTVWNGVNEAIPLSYNTVIHLAAKAHIDNCEKDRFLGEKGKTWKDNVIATKNIVEYCRETGRKLIYLSTECVFDGKKKDVCRRRRSKPDQLVWRNQTGI